MKVLMFDACYPPPVVGGKEKQAHLLASALADNGIEVTALSFEFGGSGAGVFDGVKVIRVRKTIRGYAKLFARLIRMRKKFEVLHVHTPSRIGLAVAAIGHLVGYRVFFKLPNIGLLDRAGGMDARIRLLLAKRIHTTVVLEKESEELLHKEGVEESRIMLADNGVVLDHSRQLTAAAGNEFEFVFAGRLVQHKRCADLLEAFHATGLAKDGARVRVIGDGPARTELESLVYQLGIESAVTFDGHIPDVLSRMKQAHCLVVCSAREGMPNVILEAMSVGLPIIATDVGGIVRILGSGARHFIYQVGDVSELRQLMTQLFCDRKLRESHANYLYRRCLHRFDIRAVAAAYISRYSKKSGELERQSPASGHHSDNINY